MENEISEEKYIFELKNFGIINNASINLGSFDISKKSKGSLSIIGGPNNSGKSTIAKALYSLLATFSNESIRVYNSEIKNSINLLINDLAFSIMKFRRDLRKSEVYPYGDGKFVKINNKKNKEEYLNDSNESSEFYSKLSDIVNNLRGFRDELQYLMDNDDFNIDLILESVSNLKNTIIKNDFELSNISERIENIINGIESKNQLPFFHYENLERFLSKEFGKNEYKKFFREIGGIDEDNLNEKLNLSLHFKNKERFIMGLNTNIDFVIGPDSGSDLLKFSIGDIYYIETPYILDFYRDNHPNMYATYHQNSLINKLTSRDDEEWIFKTSEEYKNQTDDDSVIQGKILFDEDTKQFFYVTKEGGITSAINTAAGIKNIGIIQNLFSRNLDNNSVIIMDEPEVHLHPKLQVELARIIVEKIAEYKIHFYINTHSPQFIEAIQSYSILYEVFDNVNYYITEESGSDGTFNFIPSNFSDLISVDPKEVDTIFGHLNDAFDVIDGISGEIASKNIVKDKK
ncbi:MAG: AAA family ATPase [Methanobrevibacter sp.]|jgi:predicted ATPase|nr:AAA family ATPase [Candidatus Methanoflexus mossambicus]